MIGEAHQPLKRSFMETMEIVTSRHWFDQRVGIHASPTGSVAVFRRPALFVGLGAILPAAAASWKFKTPVVDHHAARAIFYRMTRSQAFRVRCVHISGSQNTVPHRLLPATRQNAQI